MFTGSLQALINLQRGIPMSLLFKKKKKILLKITALTICTFLIVCYSIKGLEVSAYAEKAVITFENCYISSSEMIKYVNNFTINDETVAYKNQNISKIFANDKAIFCTEPKQSVSNSTTSILSNTSTGKVATGDSQTTIIVLTLILALSAITNKLKKVIMHNNIHVNLCPSNKKMGINFNKKVYDMYI